jgi:hypothetical protein
MLFAVFRFSGPAMIAGPKNRFAGAGRKPRGPLQVLQVLQDLYGATINSQYEPKRA